MKVKWRVVIILLLFFILFSEKISVANLIAALLISLLIYKINYDEIKDVKLFKLKTIPLWGLYIIDLIKEVIIANIHVAIIVLSPRMNISPRIVNYKSSLKGEIFLTILANSITLTPGTMTVDLQGSEFQVHCLNEDYAMGLVGNCFEKTLLKIEEAQNE
ncbi:MAG: Na+/H+ antiporter subunit E [Bacillota bacterium]|nr:Na+/H+ antiporter subunit E [Bacillota bacterium]